MNNKEKKTYKIFSVLILAAVLATIFLLSSQTSSESSKTSGYLISLLINIFGKEFSQNLIRTCAHLIEFGALGGAVFNCIYAFREEKKIFLSVLLSWCYAWTDEIHQLFVPGRAFQFIDLAVDLAGIVLGVLFVYLITRTRNNGQRITDNG